MKELKKLVYIIAIFLGCFYMPIENLRFDNAIFEALALVKWYAREHVLLCLVPAFFIAGAIAVFVNQASVIKYFGAKANKMLSYGVASVSGVILAVCSCTILPLFSGIYRRGAGLGPAIAFLYSGPAINVLAIILTARILGWKIGLARAIGAIVFSIVIGFIMHLIFIKEEHARHAKGELQPGVIKEPRPLWKNAVYFFSMIAVLVFANSGRWWITGFFLAVMVAALASWFKKDEIKDWVSATWAFALQILPLLLGGILISGFLLGRVGHEGIIPSRYVAALVGGNSLFANFFSSIVGAFMYFATLTEVPIVQGLMASGMGKGPALALLLAGPSLSLPSMLVIRGVIGTKKTAVYVVSVVIMATISGVVFGLIAE